MNSNPINNTPELQTLSRDQFWQRHVNQWCTSGLSKAAYCQQNVLIYHQMVYWSTKLEPIVEDKPVSGFVPVSVSTNVDDAGLSIRLPNGITIEGFNEHHADVMAKLIAQL